ncbi:MAG: esterase [Deltaproteobacteria bacterium]|jgi:acetyl esterase/lipase|nr:esterase [Deltaproteobacteria bacterium]
MTLERGEQIETKETAMSRAHELLPIPPRDEPEEPIPGMELTDRHREELDMSERFIPGPTHGSQEAPDVRVLLYRPKGMKGRLPILLHFHGGAFCFMHPESFAGMEANWSLGHRCVVVSIDYRLAPEHPFPAGSEDCYAGLLWVVANADELEVDLDRLVVTGGSAGGALSAAVTLMARDRGGPKIASQALMIPVLDDRLRTPSHHQSVDAPGFNAAGNEGMWLHYLGEDADRGKTSPYAAPARAEDLSGLPPAFIQTNGLDPLRDEGIEYALRLLAAGVSVELYNCPGAYHGAPPLDERAATLAFQVYNGAIGAALNPDTPTSGF